MLSRAAAKFAARFKRLTSVRAIRRFSARDDGAVAIEFGLVAMPFMAMLYATIETALIFFSGQVLETAVADSSRLILTYQAQNGNFSAADFKNQICSRVYTLFDCATGLQVDVRTAASFASADLSRPLDANGNVQTNLQYNPGTQGSIVVVRAMYVWPLTLNIAGFNLSDMAGTNKLLMATAVFRNEPK